MLSPTNERRKKGRRGKLSSVLDMVSGGFLGSDRWVSWLKLGWCSRRGT